MTDGDAKIPRCRKVWHTVIDACLRPKSALVRRHARQYLSATAGAGFFQRDRLMTPPNKQHSGEPSIVVDPKLIKPQWTNEETVVFHRDMLKAPEPPPKVSPRRLLLISAGVLLAALVLRLLLRH